MLKIKRKSPANRVLRCLNVNTMTGDKNIKLVSTSIKNNNKEAKNNNKETKRGASKSVTAYHLHEVEVETDEQFFEWDPRALTSPGFTNPITVDSGIESFEPDGRHFDFPDEVEGTVVSALTIPDSIFKEQDEKGERQMNEVVDKKSYGLVWNSQVYKTMNKLQSVQSDLKKAVHALVSLRTKSDGARSGQMLPYATDDMRKDIASVQGSVTLAKDHVDELCTEWTQKSKLPKSSSIASRPTEDFFEAMLLLSSSAPTPWTKSPRHDQDKGDRATSVNVRDACGRYSTGNKTRDSSLVGNQAASVRNNAIVGIASKKELLAVRAERDGLARDNQALISTLNIVMKELEEAEERVHFRENSLLGKDELRAADEDSSTISTHVSSCAGGPEPKRLTNMVQALSATMESLMEDRDRLSMQLKDSSQNLARTRERSGKVEAENLELKRELYGPNSQLKEASSNGKDTVSHGRVVSASLVFTRSELAQATQRIQELERAVIRLQASSMKGPNHCYRES